MIYRVRLLTQQDYDIAQSYLVDNDPLFSVEPIHGLQTFGLDSKYAKFWGAFRGDRLEGVLFTDVLLADYDNNPRFGYLTGDNPKVLARLGKFSLKTGIGFLKGKSAHIQPAVEVLSSRVKRLRLTHWNFYKTDPGRMPFRYDYPVRVATRDDIPLLLELYKDFEFGSRDLREVKFEVQKAVDRSTCFFIELEGRAVSASMIVAETAQAGMVSYVRTLPEFRGRGLFHSIRTACHEYLFKQGKVGLWAVKESNTVMIKIISKCGSVIGKRSIVYFTRKPPLRRRVRKLGSRFKNKILRQ